MSTTRLMWLLSKGIPSDDDYALQLQPSANTHYESAQDWYKSYGAHISTERGGDIEIQLIDYDDLDADDDTIIAGLYDPDASDVSRNEYAALVALARDVRSAADALDDLLSDAVDAYEQDNIEAVVSALLEANDVEKEHGDNTATRALAGQLLEESWG
jgi:hypothetical protein